MRSSRNFIALLLALTALTFVTANAQSPRNNRSLEQQIYTKILGLTEYGVFDNITFQLQGGTVTLNGKVDSMGTINEAEREVKKIPGVTNVVNNIEQLPASPYDDQIRRRALAAFLHSGAAIYFATPRPDVRIIVEGGKLTLEGYVNNKSHSDELNVIANGIPGVFSVQNNLIVGQNTFR
jgi:hyperosmotically inducible protein